LTKLVRAHDAEGVAAALADSPELVDWRDERGRNWLHVCCMAKPSGKQGAAESVATADVLLALGFDIDDAAFTEDHWRATPLWHAVARGENLELAAHLLELGADPNHCLFAAAFNNDLDAIDLLVSYGADVDERAEGETPFLGAVGWSHFAPAQRLLEHGADVNATSDKGSTALHLMLKKSSDKEHFEMLLRYEPRGDIPDANGATAAEIMRRKRDADFRAMADRLAVE
jgi:ankyrin repeat protein